MHVLAIANHKGGVGKTATTHALAYGMASSKTRVLVIDCDPQASLTGSTGHDAYQGATLADVIGGSTAGTVKLKDAIIPLTKHISLCPSNQTLALSEMGIASRIGREVILRNILKSVRNDYDLVLLDCPPALNLLSVNALCAADAVLVPTQPQIVDMLGLKFFLETVENVKELNPDLEIMGVLLTFYAAGYTHHEEAERVMLEDNLPILDVKIGRSIRVADAAAEGQSVVTRHPSNKQAEAYRQLSRKVTSWLRHHAKAA